MTSRVVSNEPGTGKEAAQAVVLIDPSTGLAQAASGGNGGVVVTTNTTAVTGTFTAVQILEDATFSVFTETGATGQTMTGFVVPAGVVLFGRITAYTLTSGRVRAYV